MAALRGTVARPNGKVILKRPLKLQRPPLPPHLTMDEYVAWIQASLQQIDPIKAARQKAMQKQISVPFQIKDVVKAPSPSEPRR